MVAPNTPGGGWTRTGRALVLVGLVLGGFGLAGAVGFGLFVGSLHWREENPAVRTDAIVALTGGARRIEDAIDLLAQGFGRRLLITGVNERTSRDEIARLAPNQRDLVQCCVDLDYKARNTIDNAFETRRWMRDHGFNSLLVVTSNYHMPRTLTELDHVLPEALKVPFAVVTDPAATWPSVQAARLLASEYVKYLVAQFRVRWIAVPQDVPGPSVRATSAEPKP
jgi:uncharacterized SAM-binding protein YcdF (DUF218 family)